MISTPMREVLRRVADAQEAGAKYGEMMGIPSAGLLENAVALRTLAARLDAEMERAAGTQYVTSAEHALARLDAPVDASPMEER